MRKALFVVAVSTFVAGMVACGSTPPPDAPPAPPSVASSAPVAETTPPPPAETTPPPAETTPPPPPKKTAKQILESGGTFMFNLDKSDDVKKAKTDECAKKAKKDEKKQADCMTAAATEAQTEGVKFEKNDKGEWVFTSFGKAKDKDVTFLKGTFKVAKDDDTSVTVNPDGKLEGTQAKGPAPKEMVFQVPDESTVVITDPKKGKLVYTKKLSRRFLLLNVRRRSDGSAVL